MQGDDDRGLYSNTGDNNPFVTSSIGKQQAKLGETTPQIGGKQTTNDSSAMSPKRDEERDSTDYSSLQWSLTESPRKHGMGWYIVGITFIAILSAVAFFVQFFTGEWQFWSTVGLAAIIFLALIVFNKRSARTINYSMDNDGIHINDIDYSYNEFRAFGLADYSDGWTVVLIPVKRLSAATIMMIPEDQSESIVDMLGELLPMEDVKSGFINSLARHLKL